MEGVRNNLSWRGKGVDLGFRLRRTDLAVAAVVKTKADS
jgi:hypothetical protein